MLLPLIQIHGEGREEKEVLAWLLTVNTSTPIPKAQPTNPSEGRALCLISHDAPTSGLCENLIALCLGHILRISPSAAMRSRIRTKGQSATAHTLPCLNHPSPEPPGKPEPPLKGREVSVRHGTFTREGPLPHRHIPIPHARKSEKSGQGGGGILQREEGATPPPRFFTDLKIKSIKIFSFNKVKV